MNRNSFVESLKRVQTNHHDAQTREARKARAFNSSGPAELVSVSQTSFDESETEPEPLCPDIRLVKRYVTHDALVAALPDHTDVLTITQLYKQVRPPDFVRPKAAAPNFVVLGIVATRSESRTSVHGNKYVVMTLSDLKYDISLALHGKSLEKFWKVRPGTLIALFNPQFYVQKAENVARNLCLSCTREDCILEVAQAKDLGQCESMTASSKHSHRCRNWVDVRRSHYCEFHLEQKFTNTRRPEFQSAPGRLHEPRNRAGGKKMTVVRGGEVDWKRGLQFDTQANQGRFTDAPKFSPFRGGFPDAPVGRVFQSNKRKADFAEGMSERKKKSESEKWQLKRISDDNRIMHSLKAKPVRKQSQFGAPQMRKLGFLPKNAARKDPKEDSDSDLEIV